MDLSSHPDPQFLKECPLGRLPNLTFLACKTWMILAQTCEKECVAINECALNVISDQ